MPVTADGNLVLVRQYRHNLKAHALEFPAGTVSDGEDLAAAALRELEEETGFTLAPGARAAAARRVLLAAVRDEQVHPRLPGGAGRGPGPPRGDTEIEKYFDMSVVVMPFEAALAAIGDTISGTETVTALMLARRALGTEDPSEA